MTAHYIERHFVFYDCHYFFDHDFALRSFLLRNNNSIKRKKYKTQKIKHKRRLRKETFKHLCAKHNETSEWMGT